MQRCFGAFKYPSSYGKQGDGKSSSTFTMGPTNGSVKALQNVPAMFVEIAYQYQPLISPYFIPTAPIQETASMLVRDNRDTSEPGINPVAGLPLRPADQVDAGLRPIFRNRSSRCVVRSSTGTPERLPSSSSIAERSAAAIAGGLR